MLQCLVPRGGQAIGRGVTALQMRLEATFEITVSVQSSTRLTASQS